MTEFEVTVRFDSREDAMRFVHDFPRTHASGAVVDVTPVLDS